MNLDINNLENKHCCRTCMTENSLIHNIFEDEINLTSIADILRTSTSLNVNKEDNLPQRICQCCYDKLASFFDFRLTAEKVEKYHRQILESNICIFTDIKESKEFNKIKIESTECVIPTIKQETCRELIVDSVIYPEKNLFLYNNDECKSEESKDCSYNKESESNKLHRTRSNKNKKYQCEECNKTYKTFTSLQKHAAKHTVNNNDTNYSTTHNDAKPFVDEYSKNENVKCKICSSIFETPLSLSDHLKVHIESHSGDTSTSNLETKNKYTQCGVCKCQFKSKNSLAAHMRKHAQKGRVLACSICSKIFNKISHLKRHEYSHEDKRPFKCSQCTKSFPTEVALNEHSIQHSNKKSHICPVCQKAFFQLGSLKGHIKIHTQDKLYLCPNCGKRFDSSTNLNQHVNRHIGLKAFACTLCPKKFVSKGELKSHSVSHTGEKLHKCEQCEATFTKQSSLALHRLRHLGVKPHQCDTCPMKFTSRSHLKRHYRIHTGEKPYRCDICERAFAQSNDLLKHRRGHLGDKIYKCTECPESFRLLCDLRQHSSQHYVSSLMQEDKEKEERGCKRYGTEEVKDINVLVGGGASNVNIKDEE